VGLKRATSRLAVKCMGSQSHRFALQMKSSVSRIGASSTNVFQKTRHHLPLEVESYPILVVVEYGVVVVDPAFAENPGFPSQIKLTVILPTQLFEPGATGQSRFVHYPPRFFFHGSTSVAIGC
jgi:hypothetical protein